MSFYFRCVWCVLLNRICRSMGEIVFGSFTAINRTVKLVENVYRCLSFTSSSPFFVPFSFSLSLFFSFSISLSKRNIKCRNEKKKKNTHLVQSFFLFFFFLFPYLSPSVRLSHTFRITNHRWRSLSHSLLFL